MKWRAHAAGAEMTWLSNRLSIVAITLPIILAGCLLATTPLRAFDCSINCTNAQNPDRCRYLRKLNCARGTHWHRHHYWHRWYRGSYGWAGPILETVFSPLYQLGGEEDDYGLFSYLLIPSDSTRAEKLVNDIFSRVPTKLKRAADRDRVNILYIPTKSDSETDVGSELGEEDSKIAEPSFAKKYMKDYYDYISARKFLNKICSHPDVTITEFCESDQSSGPYIFTYRHPATDADPMPSPFLLVDLSNVHEKAFPEFLRAYKEQVKRKNIADAERIKTFRLRVVSIVLTGADFIVPMENALQRIVHLSSDAEATQPVKGKTGAEQ
jgi:hypothetical protein